MASAFAKLDLVVAIADDHAHVAVRGDLDIDTAPRLIATLHDIAIAPVQHVDLDCQGVTFIDSAGVRALIVARTDATRRGVAVVLVEPSHAVSRVIEMTGLVGLLTGASAT